MCTGLNARRNEYDCEVSLTAYPTTLNFRNLFYKLQKWLVINLCTQKSKQTKSLMPLLLFVVCLIVTFKTKISRVLEYGKLSSQEELEVNGCIKKKSTY